MKISFIVSAYNVEKYIKTCLESIKNQTYKNIEVIVVNDGSKDDTGKICDQVVGEDTRFKIVHQENKGLSGARNVALKMITGNFLCFVDGDDYIEETLCEELEKKLRKYSSDMVVFTYFKDYNGEITPFFSNEECYGMTSKEALISLVKEDRIRSMVCMKLYKKELFDNLYFKENHHYEDVYIMHKLLFRAKHILVFNKALYYYRFRDDSISNIQNENNLIDRYESLIFRAKEIEKVYPDLRQIIMEKTGYYCLDIYNCICAHKYKNIYNIKTKIKQLIKQAKGLSKKTKLTYYIIIIAEKLGLSRILYIIIHQRIAKKYKS